MFSGRKRRHNCAEHACHEDPSARDGVAGSNSHNTGVKNLRTRRLPIVAMTANAVAGDEPKYLEAGVDGYVSKPIDKELLKVELARSAAGGKDFAPQPLAAKQYPSVDAQTFNYSELLERVDNDRELMRELLEIFKKDFPRHREELQAAVASGDLRRVQVIGHTLKGVFGNLAAGRAAVLAAQLEQIGNDTETVGLSETFEALERESKTLLPILDSCLEEVCR